jgi:hypothetical protein
MITRGTCVTHAGTNAHKIRARKYSRKDTISECKWEAGCDMQLTTDLVQWRGLAAAMNLTVP